MQETGVGHEIDEQRFYDAIRTSKLELLESLISEHVGKDDDTSDSKNRLERLLSRAYERLTVMNVPISQEMTFSVKKKLIELRFFSENNEDNIQKGRDAYDVAMQRINLIIENSEQLFQEYSGSKEVDGKFIVTARFIAQNIRVLKRQLKSTYDKLPWEEMEFCLAAFMMVKTKRSTDLVYQVLLDKTSILQHLKNFSEELNRQQSKICEADIGSRFPLTTAKKSARNNAIKSVLSNNPTFKTLFDDHEIVRTVYSLKRIETYIKTASSVDFERDDDQELGRLVLERTLQVIGESLKYSLESPNVSNELHEYLLCHGPQHLKKRLTNLRNLLSHADTLKRKMEIVVNLQSLKNIQNDLQKINQAIEVFLYEKKISALRILLQKIVNSNSLNDIKTLVSEIDNTEVEDLDLVSSHTKELTKIEQSTNAWKEEIGEPISDETRAFDIMDEWINTQKVRSSAKFNYGTIYKLLSAFINTIMYANDSAKVKTQAKTYLGLSNLPKIDKRDRYSAIVRLQIILESGCIRLHMKCCIHCFLVAIDQFESGGVKNIGKFVSAIDVVQMGNEVTEQILENIFEDIGNNSSKDGNKKLQEHIEDERNIYKAKGEIKTLILIKSTDTEKFEKLFTTLKINRKKKKTLNNCIKSKQFDELKAEIINKRCSYETLIDSVRGANARQNVSKPLQEFLRPLKLPDSLLQTVIHDKQPNILSLLLNKLKNLLPEYNIELEAKLQTAIEMAMLDVTEALLQQYHLPNNHLFFEEYSPTLTGKALRNYLAHGDLLFDSFLDAKKYNQVNSLRLTEMEENDFTRNKNHTRICQKKEQNIEDMKEHNRESTTWAGKVDKLFQAVLRRDLDEVKRQINDAGDINARDIKGRCGFYYAIKSDSVELYEFFKTYGAKIYNFNPIEMVMKFRSNNVFNNLMPSFNGDLNLLLFKAVRYGYNEGVESLMMNGASVKIERENEISLLHEAAQYGHSEVVKVLIENGADVNAQCKDDVTSLHLAVCNGHTKVAELLIRNRADVNARDHFGRTPLHLAAGNGHKEVAEVLIKNQADSSAKDSNNYIPLHFASEFGHRAAAQILIENEADVEARSKIYATSLHEAAVNSHTEVVKLLIKHCAQNCHEDCAEVMIKGKVGLDINVKGLDEEHWTYLHKNCNTAVAKFLIQHVNDHVNSKSMYGETPLYCAAGNGHTEVAQLLINYGAHVDVKTMNNLTPLHVAAYGGHIGVAMLLVGEAVHAKDYVIAKDKHDLTPLHLAAITGSTEVVQLLINKAGNANDHVTAKAEYDQTPLHYAALYGYIEIAQLLLQEVINANDYVYAKDVNEQTPLHHTALYSYIEIAQLLIQKAVNPSDYVNAKDKMSQTPLHIAACNGHFEFAQLMINHGASVDAYTLFKETPLHFTANGGYVAVAQLLIKNSVHAKDYVNTVDNNGQSALSKVAANGNVAFSQFLIDKGARIARTEKNRNPEHGHIEVVNYLIRMGAIEPVGKNLSPLHEAAYQGHNKVVKFLIEKGAEVNERTEENLTPLHQAAKYGQTDVVKFLIEKGADVDARTKENQSPLHKAVYFGHTEVVKFLIENGANVDARGKQNRFYEPYRGRYSVPVETAAMNDGRSTPLHFAIQNGQRLVVQLLIDEGADVNAPNELMRTPLHDSAYYGYTDVTKILIENGADVHAKGLENDTPLHDAVYRAHTDVAKVLIENGADVNAKDKKNETPLYGVASNGNTELCQLLLEKKAVVDAKNAQGWTPLYFATKNGHRAVVQLLIVEGADVNVQGEYNDTPLRNAAIFGHTEVARLLIENGADVNAKCNWKSTALHNSAEYGHIDVVKILLEKGADVNSKDKENSTPLHRAAFNCQTEVCQLLIERRAVVDAKNVNKSTPLHLATETGHRGFVQFLIDKGADIHARGKKNRTPLHEAANHGNSDVAKFLIEKGADVNAKDRKLLTPLHLALQPNLKFEMYSIAIMNARNEVAKALIENGADINARDKKNRTPLHKAACNGLTEVAKVLIENEADINAKDREQLTPLHLTVSKYRLSMLFQIGGNAETNEVAKVLIENGADLNAKDKKNHTPLHRTVYHCDPEVAKILIENGADPNAKDRKQLTPLHLAVSKDRRGMVYGDGDHPRIQKHKNAIVKAQTEVEKALIANGADPNAKDKKNRTPLHTAAYKGHTEFAKVLVENGANLDAKDKKNQTPLHIAAYKGHTKVTQLLKEKSADVDTKSQIEQAPLHMAFENDIKTRKIRTFGPRCKKLLAAVRRKCYCKHE